VLQGEAWRDRHTRGVHEVDPMPDLYRGMKGLRLARLPNDERDGIDAEVMAGPKRRVETLISISFIAH
jgi:aspartyl-tRNA(Asn)/glutamyl-tRNA(Gln) amidotransferase subunit A